MSIKLTLTKTIVILAITLPVWAQSRMPELSLGDPAPDLNITIIKGEPIDIHAESGEHVFLVEFWATWCPSCRASMPHLSQLQKKYEDEGLVLVGISIEEPDVIEAFVSEDRSRMEYTVAADRDLSTAYRYMVPFGVDSIPHAFVVDKSGTLVWHGHPADPAMERLIVSLLNEKNGERPRAQSSPNQEGSGKK